MNSKYQQLYETLHAAALQARDGEKLPSIKDLCAQYRVSLATLSSALNLLEKDRLIRREPKKGIYFARPEAPGRTRRVALLLPGGLEPLFVTIVTTLHRYFKALNIQLNIQLYDLSPESEAKELEALMDDDSSEGVLYLPLYPVFDTPRSAEILKEMVKRKPVVQFDREVGEGVTSFVGYECFNGSYSATWHLIEAGHRSIGLICASNDDFARPSQRLAGYFAALHDAGLPYDPQQTIIYDAFNPELSNGVIEILSRPDCPTAFFAINSVYVPHFMRKVAFVGKQIPDDVSLICYDLSDTLANLLLKITHVSEPTREAVTLAAELLLQQLDSKTPVVKSQLLPGKLVAGESCKVMPKLEIQAYNE